MTDPKEPAPLTPLIGQCPGCWSYHRVADYDRECECGERIEVIDLRTARTPSQPDLREALRAEVAVWKRLQKETTGEKDADEGYAVGLGRAFFAVEELLASHPAPADPEGKGLRSRGIQAFPTGEGQRAIDRATGAYGRPAPAGVRDPEALGPDLVKLDPC